MNINHHHIIGKQKIDFTYNGNIDAIALNNTIDQWYKNELAPAIQNSLETYGLDTNTIRLDQLTIDVEIDAGTQWQQQITEKIIHQLNEQLANKFDGIQHTSKVALTPEASFETVLLFYLENAYLPWFSNISSKQEFINTYIQWISTTVLNQPKKLLFVNLLHDRNVIDRLLEITPKENYFKIISLLIENIKDEVILIEKDINQLLINCPTEDKILYKKDFIKSLLLSVVKNSPVTDIDIFNKPVIKLFQQLIFQNIINNRILSKQNFESNTFKLQLNALPINVDKNILNEFSNSEENNIPLNVNLNEEKSFAEILKIENSIFINNAGLVILSPFLPVLFERLKITQNNLIINKPLALHVLYYLVTGNQQPVSFELVLPKVLCGIEFKENIVINTGLTLHQTTESDDLLFSVIEHWSVLKNTSIEGFRNSFLQRDGSLKYSPEGWLLQVEQKAFDMLLQQLPWNISMIKHAWMNNMLQTDWV